MIRIPSHHIQASQGHQVVENVRSFQVNEPRPARTQEGNTQIGHWNEVVGMERRGAQRLWRQMAELASSTRVQLVIHSVALVQ